MHTRDQTATTPLLDDPLAFAEKVYEETVDDDPRLATHAPAEFAAYNTARDRVKQSWPGEGGANDPLELMDERALEWGHAAFQEGIRFAIEAYRLRRALLAMAMAAEANAGM